MSPITFGSNIDGEVLNGAIVVRNSLKRELKRYEHIMMVMAAYTIAMGGTGCV